VKEVDIINDCTLRQLRWYDGQSHGACPMRHAEKAELFGTPEMHGISQWPAGRIPSRIVHRRGADDLGVAPYGVSRRTGRAKRGMSVCCHKGGVQNKKEQHFFRISHSRKAQMEMIGLVVIVILITLGMLFMAQFAMKDHPEKKIFTRKGLAYSTVSAIMKTTITDSTCVQQFVGDTFTQIGKDMVEDCAANKDTAALPQGYSQYQCRGKHSCVFVREQITELLDSTLGSWNKRYEWNTELINLQGVKPEPLFEPILNKGGCPKTRDRDSSELFFLQTEAGLVQSVLYVCD
jgi:hypothetical protein